MTMHVRYCRCGNPALDGSPVCGIVICMANDAWTRAQIEAHAAKLDEKTKSGSRR